MPLGNSFGWIFILQNPAGSPFALNFVLLLFLLVPGYALLQGWLNSTVQLDTYSRLEKILITVSGGVVLLIAMLLMNRFNILEYVVCNLGGFCNPVHIQYDASSTLSVDDIDKFSILAILSFIGAQSFVGYLSGYLVGTVSRIRMDSRPTSEKDLEQPLETAIEQSTVGEEVWVVTNSGDKITGKLYRIGSPSEEKDIFISGAVREDRDAKDGDNGEKIGLTYISHHDISQIQFPDLVPRKSGPDSNFFLRQYGKIKELVKSTRHEFWTGYYIGIISGFDLVKIVREWREDLLGRPNRVVSRISENRTVAVVKLVRRRSPIERAWLLNRFLLKQQQEDDD